LHVTKAVTKTAAMTAAPDAMAADPSAAAAGVAVAHSAAAVADPVVPAGVPVDRVVDPAVQEALVDPVVPVPALPATWVPEPPAVLPAVP
jgi:hypothetical protein